MKPQRKPRTLIDVLQLLRRKAISPARLKLLGAGVRRAGAALALTTHSTLTMTTRLIRYRQRHAARWGVVVRLGASHRCA